jgi:hypothetical protein
VPLEKQSVTKFLNVDLDIRSQVGLDEFLESLASSVIVLHRANEDAFLALNEHYPTLEETIMGWLTFFAVEWIASRSLSSLRDRCCARRGRASRGPVGSQ